MIIAYWGYLVWLRDRRAYYDHVGVGKDRVKKPMTYKEFKERMSTRESLYYSFQQSFWSWIMGEKP